MSAATATVHELRTRRLDRLEHAAREACDRFHQHDQALGPRDSTTRAWMAAAIDRDDTLRALAHEDPDHPLVQREDADDRRAWEDARDRIDAQRAGRLQRKPLDRNGWAALASTPAAGALRQTALRRLTAKLLADGVDPDLAAAVAQSHNVAWCRPPLPRAHVDALVDGVCQWRADRLRGCA
jgi:hypothetical protein